MVLKAKVVIAEIESENVTEVLTTFGQAGRPAEAVGKDLARDIQRYLGAEVPVGEYLADQILLPMAIGKASGAGGGVFRTMALSRHATTHIKILREFLDVAVKIESQSRQNVQVTI